ncbi:GNAT family N-acetyltransferase [Sphaerisporangium sp. TRM90804]|uniref:GNAT family N-acetyltransferase n=1 Tax=Sphaerisporangium sp. TRM90804 TaxID=3031113 RepID=UPI00244AC5D3|nr:GNAT family N-acetyltransferase [Sphaerisporangium sp. TRM90804]MDH2429483.1 GNAT family N-acetyltransferase [Sphaerisporangium sp. TRM90804]
MTDEHRPPARTGAPSVRFVELPGVALAALLDDDLARAGAEAGVALGEYFTTDRAKWVWRYRVEQLAKTPGIEAWLTRAVVAEPEGVVVGYAGFHGPPDEDGMVEIGYSVAPAYRRRGYARATLAELVRQAGAEAGVKTVRVTISPDNTASLATISGFGFTRAGQQWDEVDGLELIYELPA